VSALMEHRGVPIDVGVFRQLADNDTWRAVRDAMVPTIDAQYGVYVLERTSIRLNRGGIPESGLI
jgi:hypothetical protein